MIIENNILVNDMAKWISELSKENRQLRHDNEVLNRTLVSYQAIATNQAKEIATLEAVLTAHIETHG